MSSAWLIPQESASFGQKIDALSVPISPNSFEPTKSVTVATLEEATGLYSDVEALFRRLALSVSHGEINEAKETEIKQLTSQIGVELFEISFEEIFYTISIRMMEVSSATSKFQLEAWETRNPTFGVPGRSGRGLLEKVTNPTSADEGYGIGSPAAFTLLQRLLRIGDMFDQNTRLDGWQTVLDHLRQFSPELVDFFFELRKSYIRLFSKVASLKRGILRFATENQMRVPENLIDAPERACATFCYYMAFKGFERQEYITESIFSPTLFYKGLFFAEMEKFGSFLAHAFTKIDPNFAGSPRLRPIPTSPPRNPL